MRAGHDDGAAEPADKRSADRGGRRKGDEPSYDGEDARRQQPPGGLRHAERLRGVRDAAQDGKGAQGVEDEQATGPRDRRGQSEAAKSGTQDEDAAS
jgi:hypothetical protein